MGSTSTSQGNEIHGPTVIPNLNGTTPVVLYTIPLDRGDGTYVGFITCAPMHNQTDNRSTWWLEFDAAWRVMDGVASAVGITSPPNYGGDDSSVGNFAF